MHGVRLFRLADLVGVSQSTIADLLGVTRVQVNHWARGKRPIPAKYLEPLHAFIFEAMDLTRNAMHVPVPLANAAGTIQLSPEAMGKLKQNLDWQGEAIPLYLMCRDAYNAWRGKHPTAQVSRTLATLQAFAHMSPDELRQPEHAQRILTLAHELTDAAQALVKLGPPWNLPLIDPIKQEAYYVNEPSQPAKARQQSAHDRHARTRGAKPDHKPHKTLALRKY